VLLAFLSASRTQLCRRLARALLAAVRDDPAEPAYLLALLCGLRRGELLAFKWDDLDFDAVRLRFIVRLNVSARASNSSKQRARTVPMCERWLAC
jgi:integrase